jgi:hypothetical protein
LASWRALQVRFEFGVDLSDLGWLRQSVHHRDASVA